MLDLRGKLWYNCFTSEGLFFCAFFRKKGDSKQILHMLCVLYFNATIWGVEVNICELLREAVCQFNGKNKFRKTGGAEMRVKVTLACTECKQRNYNTMKNKKNDPDRLEMNKYCRFCKKHTVHKETK